MADEHELAPGAATASDVADHYDRVVAAALASGDRDALAWALAHTGDTRLVRRAAPPHGTLEGGYGRSFGPVTVGDKARWLIGRLLPPALAAEAIAEGPAWLDRFGDLLRWQAAERRFARA
ncbi:MAG: hypothetical protein ACLGIN_12815 [Candidatus Sericytochromatia bacterium]